MSKRSDGDHVPSKVLNRKLNLIIILLFVLLGLVAAQVSGLL